MNDSDPSKPAGPRSAEQLLREAVADPQQLRRYLYYLDAIKSEGLSTSVVVAPLEAAINWSRAGSLWPLTFGLACCAIEMMAAGADRFDLDRFGAGAFRPTPRQADLMIVAGTVTYKMMPRVRRLYEQIPAPKYVMAMGACTVGGGPYCKHGYHVVQGIDRFVPVDVYVPGCPPRPEALIDALLRLQEQISRKRPLMEKYSAEPPAPDEEDK